jgi:hypothetical protein
MTCVALRCDWTLPPTSGTLRRHPTKTITFQSPTCGALFYRAHRGLLRAMQAKLPLWDREDECEQLEPLNHGDRNGDRHARVPDYRPAHLVARPPTRRPQDIIRNQ